MEDDTRTTMKEFRTRAGKSMSADEMTAALADEEHPRHAEAKALNAQLQQTLQAISEQVSSAAAFARIWGSVQTNLEHAYAPAMAAMSDLVKEAVATSASATAVRYAKAGAASPAGKALYAIDRADSPFEIPDLPEFEAAPVSAMHDEQMERLGELALHLSELVRLAQESARDAAATNAETLDANRKLLRQGLLAVIGSWAAVVVTIIALLMGA